MAPGVMAAFAVLAVAAGPARCAPPYPRDVPDGRGVAVHLPAAPQRIVSLSPSATEMLFAVGAGDHVVGDTTYCNYPPAAAAIAKIGDSVPSYEKIVALRPDLVVVDDVAEREAPAQFYRLHIPFFVVHPTTLTSIEKSLKALGSACGTEHTAAQAIAAMEDKRNQARRIAAAYAARPPRVLVAVGVDPLWIAGSRTFYDDLLRNAGATNATGSLRGFVQMSKETILAEPPDVVLASQTDLAALKRDPVLGRLPAVVQGRVGDISGDIFMRPGPRLADALVSVSTTLRRVWARQAAR